LEVVIKIEVKDNNIEQALRVLKRKLQRDGFFKVIKLKNTYEKPSEKKKRILQENIKRVKKLNNLKIEFKYIAGWSSLVARQAHNLKVGGSNPSPATKSLNFS
jgi:small subunit ribosomal protein S21